MRTSSILLFAAMTHSLNAQTWLDESWGDAGISTDVITPAHEYREDLIVHEGVVYTCGMSYNAVGLAHITALLENGTPDPTWGVNGSTADLEVGVTCIAVQKDQRIIIGGSKQDNGELKAMIAAYDLNGVLDPSFGDQGIALFSPGELGATIYDMAVDEHGRIYAVGRTLSGYGESFALRTRPDGSLDLSYGTGGITLFGNDQIWTIYADACALGPGNRLVVGADAALLPDLELCWLVFELDGYGQINTEFHAGQGYYVQPASYLIGDVRYRSDGSILAYGSVRNGFWIIPGLTLLSADGIPDLSFGVGGTASYPIDPGYYCRTGRMEVTSNGTLLLSGVQQANASGPDVGMNYILATDANGSLVSSFAENGRLLQTGIPVRYALWVPNGLATDPEDRIYQAGGLIDDTIGYVMRYAEIVSGLGELPVDHVMRVWPNPATDRLYVELPANGLNIRSIRLIDATGRTCRSLDRLERPGPIDLFGLAPGSYTVELVLADGSKRTAKTVVQR